MDPQSVRVRVTLLQTYHLQMKSLRYEMREVNQIDTEKKILIVQGSEPWTDVRLICDDKGALRN